VDNGFSRRYVSATRGLAIDVARDGPVERVVGFAPCSTEAFLGGPLNRA
jgi:hypothetical protein